MGAADAEAAIVVPRPDNAQGGPTRAHPAWGQALMGRPKPVTISAAGSGSEKR
jgi:hypothetical protein